MKNKDKWQAKRMKEVNGKLTGTHMHKIIAKAYKPIIHKYAKGLLADVGCGEVPYYHWYKDNITDNICIDWSNSEQEITHLDHNHDLNTGIPFLESNLVDTVLCTDVLEHVYAPEQLFSEMTRILKPGGALILTVPFLYWIHGDPHDYHRYTNHKLKHFCEKNNMEIVELQAFGGLPEVLYDLIYKGYMFYNLPMRKLFYFFFEPFGRFLSRRGFVKRLSQSSRSVFPLGYVLVARKAGQAWQAPSKP